MKDINLYLIKIPTEFGRKYSLISNLDDGASLRKYWLIENESSRKFVLSYQGKNLENYVKFSQILIESGVSVPEIYWISEEDKIVLMEYIELEYQLSNIQDTVSQILTNLSDFIIKIQALPPTIFDQSFLKFKFDFEWNELIVPKIIGFENMAIWEEHIFTGMHEIFCYHEVPGHRDLQSSNLFYRNEKLIVIDFQDSMLIHPYYDLASFTWDSYFEADFRKRLNWAGRIAGNIFENFDENVFLWVTLQRKLHDIGAFIRAVENGKTRFIPFIKKTKLMCDWILNELNLNIKPGELWKNSKIQKY